MESLREDDLKGMNASAGGLVWVRRRNGSWWPGRILCVDELAKCLRSKKAGTPIKLLGKEEGTVDWYNLEKSKRIKAFRCGEYDDCIEKAKASAIRSNRRRANSGKHARRVDAILHALELEKCHLTDGNAKLSFSKNSSRVSCIANNLLKQQKMIFKNRRELVFTARKSGKPKEICIHELCHSVTSSEQPEQPLNSTVQEKRWKNPNDSEDDGDDGIRRMKDLQDLSLGMTLTGKPNMRDSLQEFCAKGTSGRASQIEKDFANNLCSISLRSSFKHPYTRLFHAYQNLRRRNRRRRQLTKICVSSDKVNVPLIYQGSVITGDFPSYGITMKRLNDLKSSSKKTKFSFTDNGSFNFLESSQEKTGTTVAWDEADDSLSNGLVNVPILIGERNVEGAFSLRKARPSRKIHSYAAEKLYSHSVQVCLVSKSCQGLVEASSTNSVSPINHIVQSSKKSNIRLYSKEKEHSSHSSLYMNPNSESSEDEAETACDGSLTSDISDQSVRCGSLTELSNFHESQTVPTSINSVTANEQSVVSISPRCARLELSNSVTVASLYEVELKVQANNYHGQRAPLVSLVSKLNGKAIVGHTIAIDVVDDGSSAALLNSAQLLTSRNKVDIICNLREKLDYLTESKLTVQEKKSHLSCTNSPLLKRKLLSGRKSGFSPRKIRRLSAITVDLNNRENDGEAIVEEAEASSVSCVPLRVVFSRLDEALRYSSHQER